MYSPTQVKEEEKALRPLSKGVVLNSPAKGLEVGSFLKLDNYFATPRGLRRRPAFDQFSGLPATERLDDQAIDLIAVQSTSTGWFNNFLVGTKWIRTISNTSGFTEVYRTYTTGTVTVLVGSPTKVTGVSTEWSARFIKAGDTVTIGAETRIVASVTSDTELYVTVAFTPVAGVAHTIKRSIGAARPYLIDSLVMPGEVIIMSKANEPWTISYGGAITEYVTQYPSTGRFKAACGCFFQDRVWFGNLVDGSDGEMRYRLRFSSLTDLTDFSADAAYQDLNYSASPMMRICALENLMLAGFENALLIGRLTGIPGQPLGFAMVNTGGIGIVGQRAAAEALSGVFFIGQDNIYYFNSSGFEEIGNGVIKETVERCQRLDRAQVCADLVGRRILFGFPRDNEIIEDIWAFDIQGKGWSPIKRNTYMIASPWSDNSVGWDDMGATIWTAAVETWGSYTTTNPKRYLYIENDYTIWRLGDGKGLLDADGNAIRTTIETGDMDYGSTEQNKLLKRVSMSITEDVPRLAPVIWAVEVSPDGGDTWLRKGTLKIGVGKTKGSCTAKLTSSFHRIRLTSVSAVPAYTIEEISVVVQYAGPEGGQGKQTDV